MGATATDGRANREFGGVARMQHLDRRSRSTRRVAARSTIAAATLRAESFSSTYSERANRALNVLLAAFALAVLSPLIILIALAVRLTSRGPILYTQVRVGVDRRAYAGRRVHADRRGRAHDLLKVGGDDRWSDRRASARRRDSGARLAVGRRTADLGGRAFRLYKFRSMCVDAECGTGAVWATRNDPRVTPIGGMLRKFRLDELPQLFNVLKGDMNVVGPRPERPSIFCRLRDEIPDYSLRQRARPGITGWAQVKHTYDSCLDDVKKKVRFDLEYLQRRSLWVDLEIMARTIPVMLFRRGAC
jgi:lipopolysaccharide/colanic/teichoic acid biosynthesis glycosyltransferase